MSNKNDVTYTLDSDGDRDYILPKTPKWNIDGNPAFMGSKALRAAVTRDVFGCKPKWWGYYCDWCCMCDGEEHCCDQQCSILVMPKVQEIAKRIEELGGTPPSASCDLDTFMRALLELIRGPRPTLVR